MVRQGLFFAGEGWGILFHDGTTTVNKITARAAIANSIPLKRVCVSSFAILYLVMKKITHVSIPGNAITPF